ncbi:MAG: DUF4097 family beta strand repeat-containing protein [Aristaeellaceae bacterium]
MNATVQRIVELLFEDLEMSAEVQAIKDEVMNNCQERYEDLLTQGLSEDEATGAVVESLKGMEEVLGQYPRKPVAHACGVEDGEGLVFPAAGLRSVKINLFSEDVTIEPSDDSSVHVIYDREQMPDLNVRMEGSRLTISREGEQKKKGHVFGFEGENVTINSFSDLGKLFRNLHVVATFGDSGRITLTLPEGCAPDLDVHTLSGDISLENIAAGEVSLGSTSGDISVEGVEATVLTASTTNGEVNVELPEELMLARAELRTTSGDVEARLNAQRCKAQSMSGDVSLEGRIREAEVGSVSGDVNLRADVEQVNVKSVSGDVDVTCDSEELREVTAQSTSGDVDVRLPSGIRCICLNTKTISGDVTYNVALDPNAPVRVTVSTVSGDIDVR